MSKSIQLNTTQSNKHEIRVGYKIEDEIIQYISSNFSPRKGVFIVDENVFELYEQSFIKSISAFFEEVIFCIVPEGEQSKSIAIFTNLVSQVLSSGVERSTPVLVIGGGVTGDLGGYIAASCLRGMPLIHIPTTLLSMVDSSIGGKTGINHEIGKNLIGAFYQPKAVFTDLQFLETLPHSEIVNGLGEVIKYGMISDRSILSLLKKMPIEDPFSYSREWEQLVTICAKIKIDIVSKDFRESGVREILNFGHTFAHVIERVGNYKACSHGEAVFIGMWGAVKLSELLGFNIDISNLSEFRSLYKIKFNPTETIEELISLMLHDKKVKDGSIKVIVLENVENAVSKIITDVSVLKEAWKFIIYEFK